MDPLTILLASSAAFVGPILTRVLKKVWEHIFEKKISITLKTKDGTTITLNREDTEQLTLQEFIKSIEITNPTQSDNTRNSVKS
jgi:hypothetical protein